MRTLIWGKTFVRSFKRTIKKHPSLKQDIEETLRLLTKDPFTSQLETHKLKGKLSKLMGVQCWILLPNSIRFCKERKGERGGYSLA